MLNPNVDMRDALFDEVCEIAAEDRNVILLTGDHGAFGLERFKKDMPDQYFNVGIAEQNLVNIAAGLALGGKVPFIYGITSFLVYRAYEQIRLHLSGMNLHVAIIGSGAGYTYDLEGPTHHAIQDLAMMRALPGMTIYNPSDSVTCAALGRLAYKNAGPTYVRIDKGVYPQVHENIHDFSSGFGVIGPGRDVIIVSTGVMVHQALKVADELSKLSIDTSVIDLYRIKPVDTESLVSVLEQGERIVSLEEHCVVGGIGSLLSEVLTEKGSVLPLKKIALPDQNYHENGNRRLLHAWHGLDVDSVKTMVLEWR